MKSRKITLGIMFVFAALFCAAVFATSWSETCDSCNGSGRQICGTCDGPGSGWRLAGTCPTCYGSGREEMERDWQWCDRCLRNGTSLFCPDCHGDGGWYDGGDRYVCGTCEGIGFVIGSDLSPSWWLICDACCGEGSTNCDGCGGRGIVWHDDE